PCGAVSQRDRDFLGEYGRGEGTPGMGGGGEPCSAGGSRAGAAGGAGGHSDPQHTGKHEGPLGAGHLGDLPLLVVNDAGVADQPIIAPRLKTLAEVKGKALMVHVGGDNMADSPQPLGGGGERFACGVIK
ncbi:superoxide dismutase family protein, partial [Klebsiella pneumoniae]|nr:superoxide dismutase family protein [Klebsiella pneumoniae]